jgi:hypothetical protein
MASPGGSRGDGGRAQNARGPWLAQARHHLGSMLLARKGASDGKRARALLEEALGAYRELGMETWTARAAALYEA